MWRTFIQWWRRSRRGARLNDEPLWRRQLVAIPILQGLDVQEQSTLIALARRFLQEKRVTPLGVTPSRAQLYAMALQAVLPLLHLGHGWYRNFYELILLPAEVERHEWAMQPDGVMMEEQGFHLGEAWEQGPVVLVWPELLRDGQWDGYHLLIHELLHKLDMLAGGEANGMLPERPGVVIAHWQRVWTARYEACCSGAALTWLDEQACENMAEFFAVVGEAFFTRPRRLKRDEPELYQLLACWFAQDPAQREPTGSEHTGCSLL